jgi:hypothetical protein
MYRRFVRRCLLGDLVVVWGKAFDLNKNRKKYGIIHTITLSDVQNKT